MTTYALLQPLTCQLVMRSLNGSEVYRDIFKSQRKLFSPLLLVQRNSRSNSLQLCPKPYLSSF